ncbi:hypothetical protein [Pseudomonas sp. 8O]|uniref:hypothetical protein n=1 Tax=Pseudomonas sp. 8O TaxID=2653165 RepID=UPI0012F0948C|nr:conserved hypothetical protein [Pseudomonas sp. 8O]
MTLSSLHSHLLGGLLLMVVPVAFAETLTPLQGQSPEQIQADIATCQSQTGFTGQSSSSDDSRGGERLRGAAVGAAAGAAAAEVRGRNHDDAYDRVDDDIKQEYRQNQAKDAAAVGMAVGGSRQRQDRREDRRNERSSEDAQQAYSACMSGRGYSIMP